jgi:hypothetical protein
MVIVVMLYYLLLEQAIKNYFNTDKSLKHISEVDSGYGISPENPISLEECTPNAQKVIEKFKPGKIYQCVEEQVLFQNTKIPYISINPLVVQSPHERLYAIIVKDEPKLIDIKPSVWIKYPYPSDPIEVFKQQYDCEIKDSAQYAKAEKHGEVTYEVIPHKNAYTWKVNFNNLEGRSTRDSKNICVVQGSEIKNGYSEKSTFDIKIQIVKPKPL